MVEFPVGTGGASPSSVPSPPSVGHPSARPSRLAGALVALTIAVTVLLLPGALWVRPAPLPFPGPLSLLPGALALWGAAKPDQARLAAAARRLGDENAHLVQNLGWLSDTARELRESQRALEDARQKAEAASQ